MPREFRMLIKLYYYRIKVSPWWGWWISHDHTERKVHPCRPKKVKVAIQDEQNNDGTCSIIITRVDLDFVLNNHSSQRTYGDKGNTMKHGTIIRLRYCKREDASKPICHSERKGFGYRERRIINNKENRSMLGCKRSACNRTKKSYPHNQRGRLTEKSTTS